ncbi:Utp21-domain-containing protein [Basidiobolus meristosporus CBS 931.73]|uniref:Utp21-domain-containing protein n=1 Tax=Basidiobolus meristosporus CBS 931.73 TaxID=1314790 RepID=A0A1Y1ZD67_9FUNG|nr:Utp21-domain-containing protein [Basidiobolus meristosporus CBS 931.73]|eukprot:ORY08146.1 Utp21-domain-containing protein [Basidiobolus meristosporus CBS 931.73]
MTQVDLSLKKRKTGDKKPKLTGAPRIFQPFRAIGYITNDLPFCIQSRGQAFFLTTSIGKTFQIYDMAKMNLLFVGPQTEETITAITSHGDYTYAACDNEIIAYKRSKETIRFSSEERSAIFSLSVFGEYLIALTEDNFAQLWRHDNGELYTEIEFDPAIFKISAMVHPSTYLNKSFGSPITSLTQTPVIDVIAVGLLDGTIVLHNIKKDQRIMTLKQEGKVTSVSFRTDDQHIMATANMYGDIALWDLDKRKLVHVMKGAHDGLIPSIQFLNGQPILVSSGADNSVKQWIFDSLDGLPRLLKSRSGHHGPPTMIRYYGQDGKTLLSAARDRSLRSFSTVRDSQSVELSQGSLSKKSKMLNLKVDELKLPQITNFAAANTKEKDWDNILTCHMNDTKSRTWSFQRKAIGNHLVGTSDGSYTKVAAISACGNFGFLGTITGRIEMFNMQSGLIRKTFAGADGHTKAVTGIATDALNRIVVTGALDGMIKIWDFTTATVLHTIDLEAPITSVVLHHDSDLVGVVCDDLSIRVVDVDTQKIVREFWGHRNRITDIAFSPDGRWIVSASLDGSVRTWDLPTGHLVDLFTVEHIVTSLSFSPTGDFLATSHVDNVGIFLWANRMQFSNISLRSITDDDAVAIAMPTSSGMDDEEDDEDIYLSGADGLKEREIETPEQLTENMITMSSLPRSKWQNLLNLDVIKKRNKPKEPPKAPEKAPFFLPTLPGVETKFVAPTPEQDEGAAQSRVVQMGVIRPETEFVRLLKQGHDNGGEFEEFFGYIKTLNPSGIDFELRSLSLENNFAEMLNFLEAMENRLKSRKDFELVQAYLNVFMKIHGDIIVNNPTEFIPVLQRLLGEHRQEWERVEGLLHYSLCLIDFIRNVNIS